MEEPIAVRPFGVMQPAFLHSDVANFLELPVSRHQNLAYTC